MRIRFFVILLLIATPLSAQRMDLANSVDRLSTKATDKLVMDLDASTLALASRYLSDSNPEEAQAKKIIAGLQGIYVRRLTFSTMYPATDADLQSIRDQLRIPEWSRFVEWTTAPKNDKKMKPVGPATPGAEQTEVWLFRRFSEAARKRRATGEVVVRDVDSAADGLLLLSSTPTEITVVNIVGPIRPEDFELLGGRFGIPKIAIPPKEVRY